MASSAWEKDKANVIILMFDSLDWGEIGTYGWGTLCGARTSGRSALMTGRRPIRFGRTKVV